MTNKKTYLINDEQEVNKLKLEFEKIEEMYNQKKYSSIYDEKNRHWVCKTTYKFIKKDAIDMTLEKIFKVFWKSIHSDLDFLCVKEGDFIKSGSSNQHKIFLICSLEENKKIILKSCTKNSFIKLQASFVEKNKKIILKFFETFTLLKTTYGYNETSQRNDYLRKRQISFLIDMMQLEIDNFSLSDKKKKSLKKVISKYRSILREPI